MMNQAADQYDSPWKEALEAYLQSILEFCFPRVADGIDWNAPVEFLDKELQEVVRDAALGGQRVDKLVRVKLRDGTEEWILVHVEVQHQPEVQLPLRVYQYHHRVRDRFGQRVLSLAILADERTDWRPCHYEESILGCRVQFDFPVCKLLEESKVMPYVTSIEQMAKEEGRSEGRSEGWTQGREKGREEGRAEIVLRLLRRRWESLPPGLEERIRVLSLEQLANLAEALFDFTSPGDLETWLSTHGNRV